MVLKSNYRPSDTRGKGLRIKKYYRRTKVPRRSRNEIVWKIKTFKTAVHLGELKKITDTVSGKVHPQKKNEKT